MSIFLGSCLNLGATYNTDFSSYNLLLLPVASTSRRCGLQMGAAVSPLCADRGSQDRIHPDDTLRPAKGCVGDQGRTVISPSL